MNEHSLTRDGWIVVVDSLGTPPEPTWAQDWPIEISSTYRTSDWLVKYLNFLETEIGHPYAKELVFVLVMDIANGMEAKGVLMPETWERIENVVRDSHGELLESLEYWLPSDGTLPEDGWPIGPRALKLFNMLRRPSGV